MDALPLTFDAGMRRCSASHRICFCCPRLFVALLAQAIINNWLVTFPWSVTMRRRLTLTPFLLWHAFRPWLAIHHHTLGLSSTDTPRRTPTTNLRKLVLSEGHLTAPTLAWDLNETWLCAYGYGAGKGDTITHHYGPIVAHFRRQTQFVKEKPRRGVRGSSGPWGTCGERGTSRHTLWLNTVQISVN